MLLDRNNTAVHNDGKKQQMMQQACCSSAASSNGLLNACPACQADSIVNRHGRHPSCLVGLVVLLLLLPSLFPASDFCPFIVGSKRTQVVVGLAIFLSVLVRLHRPALRLDTANCLLEQLMWRLALPHGHLRVVVVKISRKL